MEKTALIFEGGGMRGLFTAGAVDAIIEKKLRFDAVYSVSVGSCHAISCMSKHSKTAVQNLPSFLRRVQATASSRSLTRSSPGIVKMLEDRKQAIVIRPPKAVSVGRLKRNPDKLNALCYSGYELAIKAFN
jgi:predicted patatin/cPLA2 family phospholipase